MADQTTISNMALSLIGSTATVVSISPPDGSVEAGYCAQFFSQARTEMLELGTFSFSLKRKQLSQVTNASNVWLYAYQLPSDCLAAKRIFTLGGRTVFQTYDLPNVFEDGERDSAPFQIEGDVIYTNETEAVLLYVRDVADVTKFSPSFVAALAHKLAAYIAGPIIKGADGVRAASGLHDLANSIAAASNTADANKSAANNSMLPSSVAARR